MSNYNGKIYTPADEVPFKVGDKVLYKRNSREWSKARYLACYAWTFYLADVEGHPIMCETIKAIPVPKMVLPDLKGEWVISKSNRHCAYLIEDDDLPNNECYFNGEWNSIDDLMRDMLYQNGDPIVMVPEGGEG